MFFEAVAGSTVVEVAASPEPKRTKQILALAVAADEATVSDSGQKRDRGDRSQEFLGRNMERRLLRQEGSSSEAWITWQKLKSGGRAVSEVRKQFMEMSRTDHGWDWANAKRWMTRESEETTTTTTTTSAAAATTATTMATATSTTTIAVIDAIAFLRRPS